MNLMSSSLKVYKGVVSAVESSKIFVAVEICADETCGSCAMAHTCSSQSQSRQSLTVSARTAEGVEAPKPGDKVEVTTRDISPASAASALCCFPLGVFVLGMIFAKFVDMPKPLAVIVALAASVLALLAIKYLWDRKINWTITSILR